ncbi:hypothetical protein, partial [Mesorhizobium salmacidum]
MLNHSLTNIAHPVERQQGQFWASTRSASVARSLMPSSHPSGKRPSWKQCVMEAPALWRRHLDDTFEFLNQIRKSSS